MRFFLNRSPNSIHAKPTEPPGPAKTHWLLGELKPFIRNPPEYLNAMVHEYGSIVSIPLGINRVFLVNDPELVREVLVTQHDAFIKDKKGRDVMGRALGTGLVTSEGALHKRQRKLLQPAFQHRRIETYAPIMTDLTARQLDSWQGGEQRLISEDMNRLTMAIAVKTLFGVELNESEYTVGHAIGRLQKLAMRELTRIVPRPLWWPNASNRELKRERAQLHAVIQRFIDEQRALGEDRGDLLSALVQSADVGDMSNQQLRDELVTLFAAGHETTANAMSWVWALLSEHPEVEHALHLELDTVLAGREPTVDDLSHLPFTEAVFKETLRIKPPVWMLNVRRAVRTTKLGKYNVPKGSLLFVSPYTLHRNAEYFPDAESFRPERWLDERASKLPRTAYLPFGAGHRVCIGSQFSMQEGMLLIATIAQRFRLRLAEKGQVAGLATITFAPAKPMAMRVEKRGRVTQNALATS